MHMVPHLPRNTDAARWALSLKPCRHVHDITVNITAIWNHIADIDADAEADGSIRGLIPVMDRDFLLHLHGTAHRSVYAVEHDEQGIAPSLDDPAAMLADCRIDHLSP